MHMFSCTCTCVCVCVCVCVLVTQLYPTLWDPMDCSPPGSSVHGILQGRILKWVISPPKELPDPGIQPTSPALKANFLPSEQTGKPWIGDTLGLPVGSTVKESTCRCRRQKRLRFGPWVGKIPWRKAWQPTPLFLPGEFYEQRNLAGYSLLGHKESDITGAT